MKPKTKSQKPQKQPKTPKTRSLKRLLCRIPRPVRRGILSAFLSLTLAAVLLGVLILTVSACMKDATWDSIVTDAMTADGKPDLAGYDCILVLGAGVRPDGTPSPMLYDRVRVACEIYDGKVPLLMSGDHTGDYNEVGAMKSLAVDMGVPSEDIFLDHEGYSTYESIFRAKEKFGAKRIVIVSQGYHLHRAVFTARQLGMEALGVTSDLRDYHLQTKYEVRELLARYKDLFVAAKGDVPCVVGETVDLSGDGNNT